MDEEEKTFSSMFVVVAYNLISYLVFTLLAQW